MESSTLHLIQFLQHAEDRRELEQLLLIKRDFFKNRLLRKGYRFHDRQFIGYFRLTEDDARLLRQYEEVEYLCEGVAGSWPYHAAEEERFFAIRDHFESAVAQVLYKAENELMYV